jgi:hypothetical protein
MEHPWEDYLLERKVESDLKDLLKSDLGGRIVGGAVTSA